MRKLLIPAVVAALLGLLTASRAHAYGAVNRTATYTNPYTGRTATATETTAYGPNGAYRAGSVEGIAARVGNDSTEQRLEDISLRPGSTRSFHPGRAKSLCRKAIRLPTDAEPALRTPTRGVTR